MSIVANLVSLHIMFTMDDYAQDKQIDLTRASAIALFIGAGLMGITVTYCAIAIGYNWEHPPYAKRDRFFALRDEVHYISG